MSITTHQRPGVYSDYDVSALIHGSGRGSVVGLAAINNQVESGKVWTVTASDSFQIELIKHNEADVKVDVIFPPYGGHDRECFVITENYHLREFLAPLHALIPQNQTIKDFVGGGMLQVKR